MDTLSRAGIALLMAFAVAGCEPETRSAPPASNVEVGTVVLEPQSVPRSVELPGRVVALATAEIRPQVDGIVRDIAFKEGGQVAAGDVLYELDDSKFRAAYNAAAAAIRKAEAATTGTRSMVERYEKLVVDKGVSAQTLDDAHSELLQNQASEEAAKADLETARINLDHTTIRAPIGGMIGVSSVSVGALVTANQSDALVTIRQIDPIHVDLVDSSANLLRVGDEVESGKLGRAPGKPPEVKLTLENGKAYARTGTLSLAEMVVSETTGTFTLRATFDNPERVLVPGMFVRATVDLGDMPGAFLVPQRAVTRGDDGAATLYVVSADGKAELRKVTADDSLGNDWIVTDGVKQGDRLIVDGFQKISDGTAVTPAEATIDADGVVAQKLKPAAAEAGK